MMTFGQYLESLLPSTCVSSPPSTSTVPCYLFDPSFDLEAKELLDDYSVPPIFLKNTIDVTDQMYKDKALKGGQFTVPDYRWFLAGPPGTGSILHTDPLATHAWNALVK